MARLVFTILVFIYTSDSQASARNECVALFSGVEKRSAIEPILVEGDDHHPARLSVNQKDGSYAIFDFLNEGIVHAATSAVHTLTDSTNPIFSTPMVSSHFRRKWSRYPKVEKRSAGKVKTADVGLSVSRGELATEIFDTNGKSVVRITPTNSRNDWKALTIETDATHIYGLGEYPRGVGTDEPWAGWVAGTNGEHGNIMSPFFGGVQTYTQFPVAYGLREDGSAFAIFVDTPYKIEWDFRKPGSWTVSTWGHELRYFVFTGRDLKEVHRKYLSLIGKSPVPPRSVLGNGISKFGYRNWDEVDRDIQEMKDAGLPVGMLSLDLYWFGGDFIHDPYSHKGQHTKMGTLTPDPQNFPNFAAKIAELKSQGTDVMLISESYVNSNLPEAKQLVEWGCVVKDENGSPITFDNKWWGTGYMIDWTHPNSKEWIKLKYVPLAKQGIRNFWFDLGEPEAGLYAPNGRYYGIESGKNNHGDVHNIYNLMWVKRFKQVMDQEMPNDRFYIMNRSGTSGLNRFGAGKWGGDAGMSVVQDSGNPNLASGDIPELIAHLQNRIKNMPLVGVDYYTSDIGGFHRWALGGNKANRDAAYTVWYANSALLDMPFRPHLWVKDEENNYLPTDIGHVASNVANTKLRAELEPYYYQAAHRAHDDGTPIVAPLVYHHPNDPVVREMGHEAYIGEDLLMGVVGNIYETNRNVYLPQGGWYEFATNRFYPGKTGRWLQNVSVYQNENLTLPLFAREGSILPLNRVAVDGARIGGDKELRVRIFAGDKPSETKLVDDDGTSLGYENGEVQKTLVRQEKTSSGVEVTILPSEGNYIGAPSVRTQTVEMVLPRGKVVSVSIDGEEINISPIEERGNSNKAFAYFDSHKNVFVVSSARLVSAKTIYSFKVKM